MRSFVCIWKLFGINKKTHKSKHTANFELKNDEFVSIRQFSRKKLQRYNPT